MRAKFTFYYFYVLRVAWSRLGKDITIYRKNSLRKKNQYVKSERTDDICIKKWIKKYNNLYTTNNIHMCFYFFLIFLSGEGASDIAPKPGLNIPSKFSLGSA